jgi:hypothetical protein
MELLFIHIPIELLLFLQINKMRKRIFAVLILLFLTASISAQRGRPSDFYDMPDYVAEMNDKEFDAYIKKGQKESMKNQWMFFIALIAVGIVLIASNYNSNKISQK